MVSILDAEEVQVRLRVKSRAKALEIMSRLPHLDLKPLGSKKRILRIAEDTLDAYCRGEIELDNSKAKLSSDYREKRANPCEKLAFRK